VQTPGAGRAYYQAIQKPGVVTADGTLHELDLLVLATGFDARADVRPMRLVGENGLTLDEAWADGPHAYRSVAVPGFANLFILMGPHSTIGNQSLVLTAENQADYALWWINQIREGNVVAVAPSDTATRYLGKDGLPELFPWTPTRHRELLRIPETAHFDVRTA
jgi:cation diffusion facilitator CzcD-associated flavoprotein CzcO